MVLTRKEVYEIIDSERDFQKYWDKKRASDSIDLPNDKDKAVETWILWMEEYLAKARMLATKSLDKKEALANIRNVVALGVACMEYRGAEKRATKSK